MRYYLFYPSYCKTLGRAWVTDILLRGIYIRCNISGEFGKIYQNLENLSLSNPWIKKNLPYKYTPVIWGSTLRSRLQKEHCYFQVIIPLQSGSPHNPHIRLVILTNDTLRCQIKCAPYWHRMTMKLPAWRYWPARPAMCRQDDAPPAFFYNIYKVRTGIQSNIYWINERINEWMCKAAKLANRKYQWAD